MKRKVAVLLSIIMLFTFMIPLQSFAENDKGLENAIKIAKQKFKVPDSYKFTPEVFAENGKKIWGLNWTSKDNESSIVVRVDEKGTILSYENFKPFDYSKKKLPKFSKEEAKAKADAFIKKVNPAVATKIKYVDENNSISVTDRDYIFTYIRVVNKIPFYNNNIYIGVNRETGEIQSYFLTWNEDLNFPDPSKVISSEDAKKAYIEKLGLNLIYKFSYEDEKIKLYAVYTPKFGDAYAVDALTGEKIKMDLNIFFDRGGHQIGKETSSADGGSVTLTPEEAKAVENISSLLSNEEAEKVVRDVKFFNLTSDFTLTNASLSKSWLVKEEYTWYLYFNKSNKETAEKERALGNSLIVTLNAQTGEILSFYKDSNYGEDSKVKYTKEQSKEAVEEFLKSFKPDKFKEVEFDSNNDMPKIDSEQEKIHSFSYSRKVNGILFPSNRLMVDFDAVSGEVTGFSMNWFETEFPDLGKVIKIEKVYEKLFAEIGLELQYKNRYSDEYYEKGYMPNNAKQEVRLIYGLKPGKPQFFDANTGVLLDDSGKQYKENKPAVYTDIKGHAAEKQIKALSEFGISLEGTKFKPNADITQLDFLILLSKTLDNYYMKEAVYDNKKEIDNLYKIMAKEGIVKESERNEKGAVTREEAAKFIVRTLKYDKVAGLKDIFKINFKDAKSIKSDLVGYVAIAQGLKIVDGENGNFKPKGKLTRGQAAMIIYNYLQV